MTLNDLVKLTENKLNNLYVIREIAFGLGDVIKVYNLDIEIQETSVLLDSLKTLM
jgi:hypothetical protein